MNTLKARVLLLIPTLTELGCKNGQSMLVQPAPNRQSGVSESLTVESAVSRQHHRGAWGTSGAESVPGIHKRSETA